VSNHSAKRQQATCGQIKSLLSMQSIVTCDSLHGNPAGSTMLVEARAGRGEGREVAGIEQREELL